MTKAIIINCPQVPGFVGNVVEAHPSKITLNINGKIQPLYETVPIKQAPAGRILFQGRQLSFLPPEGDVTQHDEQPTVVTSS
jgi:hypothetical protein